MTETENQSPNWEKYRQWAFNKGNPVDGNGEPLPSRAHSSLEYELITRGGERLCGKPTFSSALDGGPDNGWSVRVGKRTVTFSTYAVIAWKVIQSS